MALLLLAAAAMLLLAACGGTEKARDFEVLKFDGTPFKLSEQAGSKAVVLNFWYPSCPPCREEMPAFEEAWLELAGEPVEFLALFVPQGFDSELDARNFVAELELTFSFATDRRAQIAGDYGLEFFPVTYFIDRKGRIAASRISRLEADEIVSLVRELNES